MKEHHYKAVVEWTGNTGAGTAGYRSYDRSYTIAMEGKPLINGSSDPAFRGDPQKINPEEMLLASIASCHMLWFLHFCSDAGVVVMTYKDSASAVMEEDAKGSGCFVSAQLQIEVAVTKSVHIELLDQLHHKANQYCFIANSLNFPITHSCKGVVHSTS